MIVRVRAFGGLRRFMPDGLEQTDLTVAAGTTVAALRQAIGIPEEAIWLVSVNGRKAAPDAILSDGDLVTFLTPVDGG